MPETKPKTRQKGNGWGRSDFAELMCSYIEERNAEKRHPTKAEMTDWWEAKVSPKRAAHSYCQGLEPWEVRWVGSN